MDNKLYFKFEKNGKVVNPDNPRIKIYASASDYRDNVKVREINSDLVPSSDDNYIYESMRYSTQYEKYFMEYLRIEVYYSIDGVDYVSIFAVNQDNANEGSDFFDNDNLEKPIPPEA